MTWSKIDDGLHAHVKPIRAGLEAMGLWVLCMSYCGFRENDGFIEREVAVRQAGSEESAERCAAALIRAGLWIEREGGWNFHDWAQYNPTSAQLAKERRKKSESGRKGGLANKKRLLSTRFESASPTGEPPSRPVPTRPDPTIQTPLIPPVGGGHEATRLRGSRAPSSVAPEAVEFCRRHGLPPPSDPECASFLDYWCAVTGAKGTKADWLATWRNRPAWRGPRGQSPGHPIAIQKQPAAGPRWESVGPVKVPDAPAALTLVPTTGARS